MACWSAENATKAYLSTLKMGQKAKEPNEAEFISALAAGNNAQLMVVACGASADYSTTLALIAAANQTSGQVICIVPTIEHLDASRFALGIASQKVQFKIGEAQQLILNQYEEADFLLIDCNLENHEEILKSVQEGRKQDGTVIVGYNAFSCKGSCLSCGSNTQLLPIGEGLLVTRFGVSGTSPRYARRSIGKSPKSRWIVKVDKCTGEEHVFRIRFRDGKVIQA